MGDYGSKFAAYSSSSETESVNPLCNLIPSVVSCTLLTGGATGNPDQTNVSKWVFICKMEAHGHDRTAARLVGLSSAQYFLLGRICQNLKGSQIGKVLQELEKQENRQEVPEGNVQNHAILNMEGSSKKLFLTE